MKYPLLGATLLPLVLLSASEPPSPGSLYTSGGRLADLARDLRAYQVGDLVTIVIAGKGLRSIARDHELEPKVRGE